jgi:hypothetical protein
VVAVSREERLPVGYRFTMPHYGHCEITGHVGQSYDEFIRDIKPLPFDYVVRCGPDRLKKLMTHEFIADTTVTRPGWI